MSALRTGYIIQFNFLKFETYLIVYHTAKNLYVKLPVEEVIIIQIYVKILHIKIVFNFIHGANNVIMCIRFGFGF